LGVLSAPCSERKFGPETTLLSSSFTGSDDVLAILALKSLEKEASYPLTDDLKLPPPGSRLLTVCRSLNDGVRCGASGGLQEPGVLPLLLWEPGVAGVVSASAAGAGCSAAAVGVTVWRGMAAVLAVGMSIERCGGLFGW
jgi:hypothetical protein